MTWALETDIRDSIRRPAGVPSESISMVKDTFYFASVDKSRPIDRALSVFLRPHVNA